METPHLKVGVIISANTDSSNKIKQADHQTIKKQIINLSIHEEKSKSTKRKSEKPKVFPSSHSNKRSQSPYFKNIRKKSPDPFEESLLHTSI